MRKKDLYLAEVTDTFGGELNYSWVRRYRIRARSILGAVRKLHNAEGLNFRKIWGDCDQATYQAKGACIAASIQYCSDTADRYVYAPTEL